MTRTLTVTRTHTRKIRTTVWTSVSLPGLHCWPDAPDEVDYLRSRHRHLFRITVWVEVAHDDRDVEFHILQSYIRAVWESGAKQQEMRPGFGRECGTRSCEHLAGWVADELFARYEIRPAAVEVSEDGESGARLEWTEIPDA